MGTVNKRPPLAKVIRWAGMYLELVNKRGVPIFTWALVAAERFETEEAAHARILDAETFPGDYEIIDAPTK